MATTIQTLQILEPIQKPQQLPIHLTSMATKTYHARTGAYKPPKKARQANTLPTTPTTMDSPVHNLADELHHILTALKQLPNLAPGPQVNTLLSRLVDLCAEPYSEEFANDVLQINGMQTIASALRPICAEAEGELERHWAQRMLDTSDSVAASRTQSLLSTFPYHQNYIDLSRLECSILESFLPVRVPETRPSPSKIAFIGSGPLPFTSFCVLDRYPNAIVHNVDRDASALQISERLAKKLGYGEKMSFACEDISLKQNHAVANGEGHAEKTNWKEYQVVFLAALVGMDTSAKLAILTSLAAKLEPGTLVVARSARGLRTLLYPVLELSDDLQRTGLEILAVVHPWTKVVNSVVVLRVKER